MKWTKKKPKKLRVIEVHFPVHFAPKRRKKYESINSFLFLIICLLITQERYDGINEITNSIKKPSIKTWETYGRLNGRRYKEEKNRFFIKRWTIHEKHQWEIILFFFAIITWKRFGACWLLLRRQRRWRFLIFSSLHEEVYFLVFTGLD